MPLPWADFLVRQADRGRPADTTEDLALGQALGVWRQDIASYSNSSHILPLTTRQPDGMGG